MGPGERARGRRSSSIAVVLECRGVDSAGAFRLDVFEGACVAASVAALPV